MKQSLRLAALAVALLAGGALLALSQPAAASHLTNRPPACTCRASLSFGRPALQWSGDTLTFNPTVNLAIRTRGDAGAPPVTVSLHHEGSTSYSSEDVSVPAGTSFSGDRTVVANIPCRSRYTFSGYQLPAVPLPGLTRSLLGSRQELDGVIQMKAAIAGCGFEEEHRQSTFTLKQFGNLFVRSWRSVR